MSLKVYVYGRSGDAGLWYSIDLGSFKVSQVAKIELAEEGDWTLMGDRIYWAGGRKKVIEALSDGCISWRSSFSRELLSHDITSKDPDHWEIQGPPMKHPRSLPTLFPVDGCKIVVLGGRIPFRKARCEEIERFSAEAYNLDTKTWDFTGLNINEFASVFSCFNSTPVRDLKGEQVIFYLSTRRHLLFYNVYDHTFKLEAHPNFALMPTLTYPGIFHLVVHNVTPVVSNSTLYWFGYDLYLYGYDFLQRRWFRSQHLKEELSSWERPRHDQLIYGFFPFLVDMYTGDFLLILPTIYGYFRMAYLAVSKLKLEPEPKPNSTGLLDVTVSSLQIVSPGSYFCPVNGVIPL